MRGAWVLLLLCACSRGSSGSGAPGDDASGHPEAQPKDPTSSVEASAPPVGSFALPAGSAQDDVKPPAGEAARSTVTKLESDPLLASYADRIAAHFDGDAGAKRRGPFLLQRASLTGGRALFLLSLPDESLPFALAVDSGHVEWAKDRPTAGILPPVQHLAIAPHPDGGAVMFAFVPAVYTVAARLWSPDGGPFADLQIMGLDACDALSAAYVPGNGWLVVASRHGGARAQLLREDGTTAWPREGLEVGEPWRAAAPVTIVVDTPHTVMLLQYATVSGADHVVAKAVNLEGYTIWHEPVDVGAVPLVRAGDERLAASLAADGAVRVELPHGAQARSARAASIDPQGAVRWLSR